ncbi:MAG TPA: hypothetical protein VFC63_26085, partial [Blastocatellia bacterium]|nr:hypothetical protein [Blastocatellia bacterium]
MKRKVIVGLIFLLAISISLFVKNRVAAAKSSPQTLTQGSYRSEKNGWIFVHLEGTPEKIGYQHGYLLANEIDGLLGVLKPFLLHETKHDWDFYRDAGRTIL